MKKIVMMMLAGLMVMTARAESTTVTSPNGRLVVTVSDADGRISYGVSYDGQPMLLPSALGLQTNIGDFTQNMTFKEAKQSRIDRTYQLSRVKTVQSHYVAQQADITYINKDGNALIVTFCVSDNDIAFRYTLQPQRRGDSDILSAVVYGEATAFRFPDVTTTFLTPQSLPMVGWQNTKPSYEEDYQVDAPLTQRSAFGEGFTFPCLFRVGDQGWVLVSETGVDGSYVGSHLSDYDADKGYTIAFPNKGEMQGLGSPWAGVSLPASTPWRTITLGSTLQPIVETTIPYDVVESRYEASQQYKSGRYTWSWLIWQDNSCNYDDQVTMIDLAATMGYEYVLVDALWDTQIGRERLADLSRYAQKKGVRLLLWYNSNGYWNNAPQGLRHGMHTALARNREMAWMQQLGIAGIKVDFFGGDKQQMMQLYEDILSDANRYGLQVIFHGCTLPRGWERMYPNYVASEATLASENVYFSEYHAQRESFELCIHPFCRNAVAAFDWGGIMMKHHMDRDNKSRHPRYTTDIFEMASGIVLQTSVNCVALYPNNLDELPAFELDFLRQLPTTWQQTRFIDGYPGRYVVLARQSTAGQWYVAGLNAEKTPKTLKLSLPQFAGQAVKLYVDEVPKKQQTSVPVLKTLKVGKNGEATVTMQPHGGLIIMP